MDYGEIAKRAWGQRLDADLQSTIYQIANVIKPKLGEVGLELKTVRGMGYALGVAE